MTDLRRSAEQLGLTENDYVQYGEGVGKLKPSAAFLEDDAKLPGQLVLVSAINPTPAGEGKTTISIGLADGLRARGVRSVAALRQPSLGPTLGSKGGGAGGGNARLEPFERVNLGLTGDLHAVASAQNLLVSLVDNAIQFNTAPLDSRRVDVPRLIDLDDRALRDVITGLGGPLNGTPREGRFDITAAGEVMAILCLARNWGDLKARLGRMRVGSSATGEIVTAAAVGAVGGMAVVLRDALLPNLLQTREGTVALVHGGPFANIAHGCSSVVATRFALGRAEVVVTEGGFGFDLGAEKFLDIKCRAAGIWPSAVVLVATLKALKMHGGVAQADAGKPNPTALKEGCGNLRQHLQTAKIFGLTPVVALNLFPDDPEEELRTVEAFIEEQGAASARVSVYVDGAKGGTALADKVLAVLKTRKAAKLEPQYLYPLDLPLKAKIERIAQVVYGATGVEYAPQADRELAQAEASGMLNAPVCMAKTHLSLTADPKKGGKPQPHVLPVKSVRVSAGAGFVVALCGEIMTMPGLGKAPAVLTMDLTDTGEIVGLK
jgi:formate--tetrahydrofolate ligase